MMRLSAAIVVITALLTGFGQIASAADAPQVERVIALSPHAVELIFELGAGDRIVATTDFADYPEAAKAIPRVGGYHGIQIEQVMSLKPDLIVAWEGGNPDTDLARMESLGLPVYRGKTESLGDIATELEHLGNSLGLKEEGVRAAQEFRARWADVQQRNARKPPIRFFYQLWSDPLRAMAAGSWINEMLTSCGGVNIFDDTAVDYPQVSTETILLKAPQAIIVPSHHGRVVEINAQWKRWPEIPAVANGHIFFINGDLLHRFSVRVIQGMDEICRAFDQVRAHSHHADPAFIGDE